MGDFSDLLRYTSYTSDDCWYEKYGNRSWCDEFDMENPSYREHRWYNSKNGRRYRRSEEVAFYRPDGDFEGKDIGWCLDNGFHEIYPGTWSGDWYYDHHPNFKEEQEESARLTTEKKRKMAASKSSVGIKQRRRNLMDAKKFGCPVPFCRKFFSTKKAMNSHIQDKRGEAHSRYRDQNKSSLEAVDGPDASPELPSQTLVRKGSASKDSEESSPTQTDIRSFFAPT